MIDAIKTFLIDVLGAHFGVMICAMIPIIELRGAIPYSQLPRVSLPLLQAYIVAVIGNMVPVPFIYLFARKFLEWGQDKKFIGGVCSFFLTKGKRGGEKLTEKAGRGLFVALFIFVGIPLPGTGAWTGTLAASLLDMNFKETIIAVICGVLLAGIIMLAISLGAFGAIQALFVK